MNWFQIFMGFLICCRTSLLYSCPRAALHINDRCSQLVNSWKLLPGPSLGTLLSISGTGEVCLPRNICVRQTFTYVCICVSTCLWDSLTFVNMKAFTWACTVCSCFSRLRRASSSSSCCSSKVFFSTSSWRIWPLRFSFWRVSSCRNSYMPDHTGNYYQTKEKQGHISVIPFMFSITDTCYVVQWIFTHMKLQEMLNWDFSCFK